MGRIYKERRRKRFVWNEGELIDGRKKGSEKNYGKAETV